MTLEAIQKSFLIDQTKQEVDVDSINGAVIGGLVDLQALDEIGSQYKNAADQLVSYVSKNRDIAYEYAYPIIFLYRHYLELKLKSIKPTFKNNHPFEPLLDHLLEWSDHPRIPQWVRNALKDRVNEFKIIDNSSMRFRYPLGNDDEVGEEYLVDLSRMKGAIADIEIIIEIISMEIKAMEAQVK
jgi:hypothetical protein